MISQKIREIEDSIYSLSQEEQKILLERITKKINLNNQFSNKNELEKKIREMANDPEIQTEIAAINQEFLITEMDGL